MNRKELKDRAKIALGANYWASVIAGAVISLFTIAITFKGKPGMSWEEMREAVATGGSIGFFVQMFLINPLSVGVNRFFIKNANGEREDDGALLKCLLYPFTHGYINVVIKMFLMNLFIGLWTILFIVPGIIKAFEYMMIPYILAENPKAEYHMLMGTTKSMMKGYKFEAFILGLSLIGWWFLAAITFGLVGVFYVYPYTEYTFAHFYLKLKNK